MIRDLVDLLDRRWKLLDEETGFDFARNCFPFLEQLRRDSRTSALLTDLRRDEQESSRLRAQADDDARASLTQILDVLEKFRPDAFFPPPKDQDDPDHSLPALRRLLTKPAIDPDDEEWHAGSNSGSDSRLETVLTVLEEVAKNAKLEDQQERIDDVKQALEHAERARRIFVRTSAAAALARIKRDLQDLHPPASKQGWDAERARLLRTRDGRLARIQDALFGTRVQIRNSDEIAGEDDVLEMRRGMKRIYEEIRGRLGAERSLVAVFDRYRHRCQWYEADRLRDVAAHGRGKPEDRLTATLAAYLFDHGLNPLTRPLAGPLQPDMLGAGPLQPDMLGAGPRFSFYVEAKQYRRTNRAYLVKGMQQVWDMLHQIRGTPVDVAEAFYVIYRRGGPRYTFPVDRVQHGDRVVHVMLIDIAPADRRGSRAPQTVSIEPDELLPLQSKPPTRRRRR